MTDSSQTNLQPGTMIAGFRIEESIGAGAMAVVYRAVQVNLARPVALKILPRDFSRSRDYVDRFFNEARAAAAISHPNIVRAYDAGIDEHDICYFAMEFIEGETVLDRIEREQRLPVLDGLQTAIHISEALDYGWRTHRLTHGDIKPANLMINTRGETKLADFGLAKVAEIENVSGSVMLTPLYASPEIIQGYEPVEDCRPDIYSFGATLYHMLSGSPPFPGDDSKKVMRMQVEAALTPLNKVNGEVPRSVSDFVSALLRKDPDKRVQSWSAVTDGLNKAMGDLTRRGTVTMAKATKKAQTVPSGQEPHALHLQRRKNHKHISAKPKNTGIKTLVNGIIAGIVIILILLLVLMAVKKSHRKPQASPPPPVNSGQNTTDASDAERHWQQLQAELVRQDGAAARIRVLQEFGANGYAKSDRIRFNSLMRQQRRALRDERLAQRPHVDEPPSRPPKPPVEPPIGGEGPDNNAPPPSPEQIAALERAQSDAYTGLVFKADTYEMSLLSPPGELLAAAKAWQEEFSDESDYTPRVALLVSTVIPSFQRLRSVIIANKEIFTGLQLPEMDDRVRAIDAAGVQTVVTLHGGSGKVERTLGWKDVDGSNFVKAFAKQLLSKNELTPDEIRVALSCMLFDGAVPAIESLVRKLPAEEARPWLLLADDMANAPREQAALDQLALLRQNVKDQRFQEAMHILEALLQTPSLVRQRYAEELAEFVTLIRPHTPEGILEETLEKARTTYNADPRGALSLVANALTRYGRLQSPRTTEIRALAGQIVERLAGEIGNIDEVDDFYSLYTPYTRPSPVRFGNSLAALHLYGQLAILPEEVVRYHDAFEGMAWIEVGNWDTGIALFSDISGSRRADLSQKVKFQFALTDCMIRARRGESTGANLDTQVSELMSFAGGDSPNSLLASLAMQFAIVSERIPRGQQLISTPPENVAASPSSLLAWAEAAVALHMTAGDLALAGQTSMKASRLIRREDDNEEWLNNNARTLRVLAKKLGQLVDAEEMEVPGTGVLGHLNSSANGRWILYMLATKDVLGIEQRKELLERLSDQQYLCTPLDGKRLFDMLLGNVADDLAKGELSVAESRVSSFLELTAPCLGEYYPRLLALKAGILILDRKPGQAQGTLKALESAAVASPAEKNWTQYAKRSPAERVANRTAGKPYDGDLVPEQAYWESWLNCCYWRTLGDRSEIATREASVMLELTCVPGKRQLAMAARDFKVSAE